MKVIKDNSKKRITCNNCDSILEYNNNDIITERRPDGRKMICCPICKNFIDIGNVSKKHDSNNLYSTCPKCGKNKLTRLHIEDCEIYSCLNCWYEIDFEGGTK